MADRIERPIHISLLKSSQKASRYPTRRQINSVDGSIAAFVSCKNTALPLLKITIKSNDPVALKGHKCRQKLRGAKGSEVDEDVHARLGDSTSEAGPSVERVENISFSPKNDGLPKRILRSHRNIRHVLKFTKEEDDFLREGITKHGR